MYIGVSLGCSGGTLSLKALQPLQREGLIYKVVQSKKEMQVSPDMEAL